jgi:hypothetical protein
MKSKKCKCKKHKKKKKLKDYLAEIDEVKLVAQAAYDDGFKEGLRIATAKRIAKRMLAKGFEVALVCELTALPLAEIEEFL